MRSGVSIRRETPSDRVIVAIVAPTKDQQRRQKLMSMVCL
jgi:hypothetical protein